MLKCWNFGEILQDKCNVRSDLFGLGRSNAPPDRTGHTLRPISTEAFPGSLGLDAACGNGDHSLWLAEAVSPNGQVVGLDISGGTSLEQRSHPIKRD